MHMTTIKSGIYASVTVYVPEINLQSKSVIQYLKKSQHIPEE